MKFVHIADVHLGMKPDEGFHWSKKRSRELYESFFQVLTYCESEQIDLLLIAGDLFHRQPTRNELETVNDAFQTLTKTKVVLIAGSHDYVGASSEYRGIKWANQVRMLSWKEPEHYYIEELDTYIYGYSYDQEEMTSNWFPGCKPVSKQGMHILMAYGDMSHNNATDIEQLEQAGFDYIALGCCHKPERIAKTIAYAGSLEPLERTERGPRGFIQGEISKEGLGLQLVSFSTRQYEEVNVMVDSSMNEQAIYDTVKAAMEEKNSKHILCIRIEGTIDQSITIDEQQVYQLGNVVEVVNATHPAYAYQQLAFENKDNMIGLYIQAMDKKEIAANNRALYYGVKALLDSRYS